RQFPPFAIQLPSVPGRARFGAAPVIGDRPMSTQSTRLASRLMVTPSVLLLFIWMAVPLAMTLYFSFRLYRLLSPDRSGWVGLTNFKWFFSAPDFWLALFNTLALVGGVLII